MVDRYATNQFYNFNYESVFGATEAQSVGSTDNPSFIYPPKTLRNSVTGNTTQIQRGYIRMMGEIVGEQYKSLARRRLHFQFNPDSITRSVSARNDIQLWMNMDPSQMTQPVPGDANFAFELLFNREAEVVSGTYNGVNYNTGVNYSNTQLNNIANNAAANLPLEGIGTINQASVTDIGVLADLIVFDELIGQGLNSGLLDAMVKRAETGFAYTAATAAQNDKDSTSDDEDKEETPKSVTEKKDPATVKSILEANWGNSAFLVSQPIRVVFSSLFMVEGYVSSTSVTFNKFTPTMVPTQAVVGVQMQAMYMGFAKKDTFFTKTFQANEEEYKKVVANKNAEESALSSLGLKPFKKIFGATDEAWLVAVDGVVDSSGDPDKVKIRYLASDELKTEIKEKASITSVTVEATLSYTYKGNSSSIPSGVVAVDTEVYTETSSATLSTNEFKNDEPWSTAEFTFIKKPGDAGVTYDKTATSKYLLVLKVIATIVGSGGSSVECKQITYLKKEVSWGQKVSLGNEAQLLVPEDKDYKP
jgi:hypothetical protein